MKKDFVTFSILIVVIKYNKYLNLKFDSKNFNIKIVII